MKRPLLFAAAFALGIMTSSIAEAQPRSPDAERRKVVAAAQIDSWTPKAGAVGTVVSVNGSGFTRNMMVLVGGRKVRPLKMGTRVISFKIPASYGDGLIVMRQAGVAQDYNIGTFQVWADPQVSSFSPSSGAPGTRVEIRGSNFNPDDLVMLGTQSLRIERFTGNSIIVTIPQAAVTGPFHIQNRRKASASSRQSFSVVAPAPFISSFNPPQGQPGTIVRVQGGNFDADVRASYGRRPIPVNRSGPNWLEITIPANARRDAAISISSRRGGSKSATKFQIEMPPVLSSYSPSWGSPGTRVVLSGRNFLADDRVSLGGIECTTIQVRDRQITVEVPTNAVSGTFSLRRGTQVTSAASRFDVFYSPILTSMNPLKGPPGTRVVLRGEQLEGARVFLGNVEVRPLTNLPHQIQFAIPEGAQSGILRVTGRGGAASYLEPFEVWNFPGIKRLSSVRGPAGATITISGSMMNNATAVFIGEVEMPIISRADYDKLVVRVPARAITGPISWTAYGRNTLTDHVFTVVRAPAIQRFSPTSGSAGTTVTIEGDNFESRTRVRYGNLSARVLRWEPNRLTVLIPPNARQSDYLSVQGEAGTSTAASPFTLLVAPTARSFAPAQAKPGSEVTVFGSGLAMETIVQVGGASAKVLRADPRGVSLTISLPELAAGSYDLSVQSRGLQTVARKRIAVEGWGTISAIRPARARVGQVVQLVGTGLTGTRVFFGSVELPVAKENRRGRKLWVSIPEGCVGSSVLTVDDRGHRSTSAVTLEVQAEAAPPVPPTIDDQRKKRRGPKVKVRRR